MTLWVFSPDNLLRPPEEVSGIFAAIESKLAALTHDPQIHNRRVRVRAIGDLALVPERTLAVIRETEQATRAYGAMELNIAVAYGGRQEIVDAIRAALTDMAGEGASLSEAIQRLNARQLPNTCTPQACLIPISSSAPAVRFGSPDFCSGKVPTVNSTFRT